MHPLILKVVRCHNYPCAGEVVTLDLCHLTTPWWIKLISHRVVIDLSSLFCNVLHKHGCGICDIIACKCINVSGFYILSMAQWTWQNVAEKEREWIASPTRITSDYSNRYAKVVKGFVRKLNSGHQATTCNISFIFRTKKQLYMCKGEWQQ